MEKINNSNSLYKSSLREIGVNCDKLNEYRKAEEESGKQPMYPGSLIKDICRLWEIYDTDRMGIYQIVLLPTIEKEIIEELVKCGFEKVDGNLYCKYNVPDFYSDCVG